MPDKRKTTKKASRSLGRKQLVTPEQKNSSGFFQDFFRFGESYTSLVLGIIVVIAVAALLVSFARNPQNTPETPSKDISATELHVNPDAPAQTTPGGTYTVREGDDLWNIAVKTYKNGFAWTQIAEVNKLTNPDVLAVGTKLSLPNLEATTQLTSLPSPTAAPTIEPTKIAQHVSPTPAMEKTITPTGPPSGTISGTTYTVQAGDSLWDISVRAYGTGDKWVEIAKANNLQNPQVIHRGNTFQLPR